MKNFTTEYSYAYLKTCFCSIMIISNPEGIKEIHFVNNDRLHFKKTIKKTSGIILTYNPSDLTPYLEEFQNYFNGNLKKFTCPIAPEGTLFQKKVWKQLMNIPYGATVSYKEIAVMIQNPKACRAVGMANNRNPVPIIIPCHRVIGKNGSLTGYKPGIKLKKELLEHEKDYTVNRSAKLKAQGSKNGGGSKKSILKQFCFKTGI